MRAVVTCQKCKLTDVQTEEVESLAGPVTAHKNCSAVRSGSPVIPLVKTTAVARSGGA